MFRGASCVLQVNTSERKLKTINR